MAKTQSTLSFMQGGEEMGELTRKHPWERTSLGHPSQWPQSLRTTVSILLNSRFPMFLFWGPQHICFYNDSYRPSLGNAGKHPSALGKPGEEVWPEIWPDIKPLIDQVLAGEPATWSEDQLLPIYRNNALEDVYWTFSYSAVTDEDGNVNGVLVVCNETTDKINTVKHLRQSQERFQNLVREASVGIVILIGAEMRIDLVNEMYGQLIGRTPEELTGKELFSFIPEAEVPFRAMLDNVRLTGEPLYLYDYPYHIFVKGQRKEGFLNIVYEPYKEADGTITGVMALCHDVTEQVKARKKLEESELFARNIIRHSEAAQIVWQGEDMIIDMVNERMLEILGRDESIIGKPYMEAIPELVGTPLLDRLKHVLHTGEPYYQSEEMFVLHRYGVSYKGYYNYSYKVLSNAAGEHYGIICTASDVTEQVLARQIIEQAEAKARLAITSADLGTYEIDLVTDEMKTDDRFNMIWGVDRNVPRSEFASFIHPDDRELRVKAHEDSLKTSNLHYEARLIWRDQSKHWVRVNGKILYDVDGRPTTLLGVIQDITEQRSFTEQLNWQVQERTEELQAMNEELTATNEELEESNEQFFEANRELEQFNYAASHDMQEPLRKVQTFSSMLLDRNSEKLDDTDKNYLHKIVASAGRMKAIIDDLLRYSQTTRLDQQFVEVDLNKVLQDVETDLELMIQQKKGIITKNQLPVIHAVPTQMHQLFQNLITNALKFSQPDVASVITIHAAEFPVEAIIKNKQLNPKVKYIHIRVSDNGIGFKQEYAEHIFGLFKRLHARTEYSGTGIGLSLCKKIAENHNGDIHASSEPNVGSTLHVILPTL